MTIPALRRAGAGALISAVTLAAGCSTYTARPLDELGHERAWRARSVADEPLADFAERLRAQHDTLEPFDHTDGIGRAEAELVALCFNPDLRLARLEADVVASRAEHAGRWDDPELSIDVLRVTESVPDRWILSPGLAFTIPLSGRISAERDLARAESHAARARVLEAEWAVRHELRLAWLDWSAATLRQEQLAGLLESVLTLSDTTTRLAAAGEMLRTEASLFSIERVRRRQELDRQRGLVREAEQRLRAIMGLAPQAPVTLLPTLAPADPPPASEDPRLGERNPSLARLRHEYDAAEHTLRTEIRKQYPDLTIGPLYESDQGQSRIGLLAGIPVPVFNANQQGIAEATARRELARAAFETRHERLIGSAAAARVRLESLLTEREQIVRDLAPLVDQQLRDARQLLELGEGGGLVLLESVLRAHDTRMHLIDVRLDEARAAAELAFLIGPALIAPRPGDELTTTPTTANPAE